MDPLRLQELLAQAWDEGFYEAIDRAPATAGWSIRWDEVTNPYVD